MDIKKIPMTYRGFKKLQDRLDYLRSTEKPAIIMAIAAARELGDLSENAEYHSAREKQGFIEGEIAELEDKISRAEVIDPKAISGDVVRFGATVKVVDEDNEEESVYQIVGVDESDIRSGLISFTAPIAKAIINKRQGQTVEVSTPSGLRVYYIESVVYK